MSRLRKIVFYLWPIVKKYQWLFWGIFVLQVLRILLSAVATPLVYKRIIDIISNSGADKISISAPLYKSIAILAVLMPVAWFFGRAAQYAISKFQASMIRDLHNTSFAAMQKHSYAFFTNNFTGSLVNKARKFVRAFEMMHDILIDNYWSSFVAFSAMFVVFFLESRLIAFIFLVMCIIYLFMVIMMSKKKVQYDIEEAAADSKITGYIADALTNIIA